MAKVLLEFDSYEDKEDLDLALNGYKYKIALQEVHERMLRPSWKYGYNDPILDSEEAAIIIEKLAEIFSEILDQYGTDI